MKLKAWLTYPEMSISVYEIEGVFRCRRYIGTISKRSHYKDCHNYLELKYYLLSIANAPKNEIISFIADLEKAKSQKDQSQKQN